MECHTYIYKKIDKVNKSYIKILCDNEIDSIKNRKLMLEDKNYEDELINWFRSNLGIIKTKEDIKKDNEIYKEYLDNNIKLLSNNTPESLLDYLINSEYSIYYKKYNNEFYLLVDNDPFKTSIYFEGVYKSSEEFINLFKKNNCKGCYILNDEEFIQDSSDAVYQLINNIMNTDDVIIEIK